MLRTSHMCPSPFSALAIFETEFSAWIVHSSLSLISLAAEFSHLPLKAKAELPALPSPLSSWKLLNQS